MTIVIRCPLFSKIRIGSTSPGTTEPLRRPADHAGLTQQALADRIGTHVTQIRRYEAGTSAPTLDVLRNIAIGLSVTIDSLVFDEHERGPSNDLALAFEATQHLNPDEQATVREPIEAMLLKHEARRWAS